MKVSDRALELVRLYGNACSGSPAEYERQERTALLKYISELELSASAERELANEWLTQMVDAKNALRKARSMAKDMMIFANNEEIYSRAKELRNHCSLALNDSETP